MSKASIEVKMRTSAVIDPTGTYRYRLLREWDETQPRACFCMLNPSTADAWRDDATIRRCLGFARSWGCGSLEVVNLFAYRATSPAVLQQASDPIGSENDRHIQEAVSAAQIVVAAWGTHGEFLKRDRAVVPLLGEAHCLGMTKSAFPRHPLRLRADTPLIGYGARLP